jgi:hypothetical protein
MRRIPATLLLLCAACLAQTTAPVPYNEIPQRHEILSNRKVTATLLELAPNESTPMYKYEHDFLSVFVSGGQAQITVPGMKPVTDKVPSGEVRFRNVANTSVGFTHAAKNEGSSPFRIVTVEFADSQGKLNKIGTTSHTCNPDNPKVCVDEKNLFCTAKVCVEDVTMAPGAVTSKHSHATDHMLVAVSDYELTDQVEGKGTVVRAHKSGEVEYIGAGITHQLTNTGKAPARFTVILWR